MMISVFLFRNIGPFLLSLIADSFLILFVVFSTLFQYFQLVFMVVLSVFFLYANRAASPAFSKLRPVQVIPR